MSSWPKLCVRCSEKDQEKLIEQKYKWSHMIFQMQTTGGYTQSQWATFYPKISICRKCWIIGIIRWWISIVIATLAVGISGAWTFGTFGEITLAGLAVLCPAVGFFMVLILLRRKVARFYAHFYYSNGYIRGFFRSKEYKKEFDNSFTSGIYVEK